MLEIGDSLRHPVTLPPRHSILARHSTISSAVWYTRATHPMIPGDHMRLAPTKLARRALALLAAGVLALPQAGRAAPLPQASGLDQPLLAANMCGAGDPGDTHFTLAATG